MEEDTGTGTATLHYTTATYGFQTNTHYEEMEEERIDEWIIGH